MLYFCKMFLRFFYDFLNIPIRQRVKYKFSCFSPPYQMIPFQCPELV